ncbi:anti-phage protein KwaB [Polaromonas sp. CG_9.11]|uniref:anti-phage protein KwaB n=1 Tax=Polaromonas sp. CG_9.11 TaxID=2787730 RepID=UPI0018CA6204|nr:anti-phage protein KwaB [Polaromonas sp. CG_9.11]MBG6077971.1 hypothetical protein [Polaromonas sp. CG_9.11]
MKTIKEVRDLINNTLAEQLNLYLYLGVKDKDINNKELKYFHADLDAKSTESILKEYTTSIKSYYSNNDLSLLPLSEVDARSDVLLKYDFHEQPAAFPHLLKLCDKQNAPIFNFADKGILDVKTLAIKISSAKTSILFFKQLYPVSLVKQNQILLMKFDERFQSVESDILKISGGFDLMVLGNDFYITSLKKFESSFNFFQIAKDIQQKTSKNILALGIVDDVLNYLADGIVPKRDMFRVAKSEIVNNGGIGILNFVINNKTRFKLSVVNGKIQLTSKESVKTFIKMLNDDYLKSDISGYNYDSLAKDKMS